MDYRPSVRQGGKQRALRVRYLFKKWLTEDGINVIVNLKGLSGLGVWEMGLLTSFKRSGPARRQTALCNLNPALKVTFTTIGLPSVLRSTPISKPPWREKL